MNRQKGMTLIGLIFSGLVVIAVAVTGMKVVPTVIEYFTVMKNIKAVAAQAGGSVREVRKAYDRQASIDETPSVTGADLDVGREGNEVVISFAYSKKIPVAGNVSICIDYSGSSLARRRSVGD